MKNPEKPLNICSSAILILCIGMIALMSSCAPRYGCYYGAVQEDHNLIETYTPAIAHHNPDVLQICDELAD